jgi:hypothetical protein
MYLDGMIYYSKSSEKPKQLAVKQRTVIDELFSSVDENHQIFEFAAATATVTVIAVVAANKKA